MGVVEYGRVADPEARDCGFAPIGWHAIVTMPRMLDVIYTGLGVRGCSWRLRRRLR